MAVQPLNRRKIVKKITYTPRRFQSDRFKRLNVSSFPPINPLIAARLPQKGQRYRLLHQKKIQR